MTDLLLMRHGETEENLRHILQGHLPGHLTERGREQARETARGLCLTPPQAIVSSDLQRCRDTADIVLQSLREALADTPDKVAKGAAALPSSILFTSLLRERDWGSATGATVDATHRITIPEDAESVGALQRRAAAFLRFAADTYPCQRVLVVSHGLFLRFLQAVRRGVDIREIKPMVNGEIRTLTCD